MNAHPGTVQDVAHRLRVAAHQAAAYVDTLDELLPYQRADLRQFAAAVAEAADRLHPVCADAVEPVGGRVVPMLRAFR